MILCLLVYKDECISKKKKKKKKIKSGIYNTFIQSTFQGFCCLLTHSHTDGSKLPRRVLEQPSGAIWGSVSYPRTRWHADRRNRGLNHRSSDDLYVTFKDHQYAVLHVCEKCLYNYNKAFLRRGNISPLHRMFQTWSAFCLFTQTAETDCTWRVVKTQNQYSHNNIKAR